MQMIRRRFIGVAVGLATGVAIAACGSSDAPAGIATGADTSIEIVLPARNIEPAQSMNAGVRLVHAGAAETVPAALVVWRSSDPAIATVDSGVILGRGLGNASISATVGSRSASQDVTVAWKPDANLTITAPSDSLPVGAHFQLQALVRNQLRVTATDWTSLNPSVASVDGEGMVTPIAVGRVTIRARFAGLVGTVTFEVGAAPAAQGFGYFYSYDAPSVDPYDNTVDWSPSPGQGYSTASGPTLFLTPPYPTSAEFGWIGPAATAPGTLFHVVPYDVAPCAAYPNDRTDLPWVVLGAPQGACFDRARLQSSDRMEFIAMSPGAFTGTLALVRPDAASITSTGVPVRQTSAGPGSVDYEVEGFVRDSLYWFVSPARADLGYCSLAPASATPSTAVARVVCRTAGGVPVEPVVSGIGFGSNAVRGDNPRAFVEVDSLGDVIRSSTNGLAISATWLASTLVEVYNVSITGVRVAEFDRLPAVFLTAVSSSAPSCVMTASRLAAAEVLLRVTCQARVAGLMIGAVY